VTTQPQISDEIQALPVETVEAIETAYTFCNPIEFAQALMAMPVPLAIKRVLLRAKVSQPPAEAVEAVSRAMERNAQAFWNRLASDGGN
jgi:hypothetical protein